MGERRAMTARIRPLPPPTGKSPHPANETSTNSTENAPTLANTLPTPANRDPVPADRAIDTGRDPDARRVADVLRAGSAARKTFLIDDEENISQAVRNGIELLALYRTENAEMSNALRTAAQQSHAPTFRMAAHVAKELFGSGKRTRIFALARSPRKARLEDLTGDAGDIVVLDGVRLAGNIGAIARTAHALGASGLILVDSGLSSVLDRRLVRASRGIAFALPIVLAGREETVAYLESQSIALVSLSADVACPLAGIRSMQGRLALLLGSERHGVSSELESKAERAFGIPINPDVESLNVSVAAGIALYSRLSREPHT